MWYLTLTIMVWAFIMPVWFVLVGINYTSEKLMDLMTVAVTPYRNHRMKRKYGER